MQTSSKSWDGSMFTTLYVLMEMYITPAKLNLYNECTLDTYTKCTYDFDFKDMSLILKLFLFGFIFRGTQIQLNNIFIKLSHFKAF